MEAGVSEAVESVTEERKPTWYIRSSQGKQSGSLDVTMTSFSVSEAVAQLIGVPRSLIRLRDFYFTNREGTSYGMQFTAVYSITGSTNELTIDLDVNRW